MSLSEIGGVRENDGEGITEHGAAESQGPWSQGLAEHRSAVEPEVAPGVGPVAPIVPVAPVRPPVDPLEEA